MKPLVIITIAIISLILRPALCGFDKNKEMTLIIEAKHVECFYEKVKENFVMEFDYQVIDGGQGDLDINFELSQNGRVIFADFKKSDNIHRLDKPHPAGEYKFCFDNTISHFNTKTVFFELTIEDPNNPRDDEDDIFNTLEGLSPEEFYEMKVQDIQDIIHNVKSQMGKARQLQDMLRSYEARDRNLAEMNCSRVTFFSVLTIVSMICVGFLQVFMIRSLFGTDAKEKRVWEKINKIVENFK